MNAALMMFERRTEPKKVPRYCTLTNALLGEELVLEDENEVEQFAMEFKSFPVRKPEFDEAFRQLKEIAEHTMKKEGLLV